MRTRVHRGFGHGLRPGSDQDLGCPSCRREREAGKWPVIAGEEEEGRMPEASSREVAEWIAGIEEAQSLFDTRAPDQAHRSLEAVLEEMRRYAGSEP